MDRPAQEKKKLLTNIARKLIELKKMLYSLAPLEWRVTISIVCFVVDSNYFLIIIMFQRL